FRRNKESSIREAKRRLAKKRITLRSSIGARKGRGVQWNSASLRHFPSGLERFMLQSLYDDRVSPFVLTPKPNSSITDATVPQYRGTLLQRSQINLPTFQDRQSGPQNKGQSTSTNHPSAVFNSLQLQ